MSERHDEGAPAGTGMAGGPTMIDVTPTPVPEPEPSPAAPVKAHVAVAAISALGVLVLALATSPYWAPPVASILPWGSVPETKPASADTSGTDAKLSALQQRLARLEQRPQETQQAQALGALGDRLAAIEQRIATLAAAATSQTAADATKGLQAEVQALAQKLDQQSQLLARLQSQETAGADRTDAALVVTVGQLRAALGTSRPYAAELQSAEALAKDRPDALAELHKLDGRASLGLPTLAMLTERFAATAKGGAQSSTPAPAADQGWRARMLATLKGLVTIRRASEPQGKASDSGGALAEAAAALKSGDLAAAVAAVRRAEGSPSPAMASWLEDAQARLDAEAALAAADATLMKRFLAEPGAGAKP